MYNGLIVFSLNFAAICRIAAAVDRTYCLQPSMEAWASVHKQPQYENSTSLHDGFPSSTNHHPQESKPHCHFEPASLPEGQMPTLQTGEKVSFTPSGVIHPELPNLAMGEPCSYAAARSDLPLELPPDIDPDRGECSYNAIAESCLWEIEASSSLLTPDFIKVNHYY